MDTLPRDLNKRLLLEMDAETIETHCKEYVNFGEFCNDVYFWQSWFSYRGLRLPIDVFPKTYSHMLLRAKHLENSLKEVEKFMKFFKKKPKNSFFEIDSLKNINEIELLNDEEYKFNFNEFSKFVYDGIYDDDVRIYYNTPKTFKLVFSGITISKFILTYNDIVTLLLKLINFKVEIGNGRIDYKIAKQF